MSVDTLIRQLLDGQLDVEAATNLVLELSQPPITKERLLTLAIAMRMRMQTIDLGVPVLDTCGTGGDGLQTFNLSTAVALQCAKLGVPVAKHGNVAATSISGSADVLQHLSIPIDLTGQAALDYFQQHNFIFLFAKLYHPAMKFVAPIRKAIGTKTIFNYVGPLCNPAGAQYQLLGVSDEQLAQPMGEALLELGSQHVVIVHSNDGLDEASIAAPTQVYDFRPDSQQQFTITPEHTYPLSTIQVSSVEDSAALITHPTPAAQAAIDLNVKLALYAANFYDHAE
jgi:anthranilate phosphoribosyltransferase